ncbi:MAG TPA: hypothetical protein VF897_18810 [Roseiflexaceae bacterium]
MLKTRIVLFAAMALLLAAGAAAAHSVTTQTSLAASTPNVLASLKLPGSDESASNAGKFPRAAASGNSIEIISNPGKDVKNWSKLDSATTVGDPVKLGGVNGNTTDRTAAIATAPDGSFYAVWIREGDGIFIRHKPAGGSWEEQRTVLSSGSSLYTVDVAVNYNGQIFVVWNQDSLLRYRISSDGGASWSGTGIVSSKTPRGRTNFRVGGGPGDAAVVGFASSSGRVYGAVWDGSSFTATDLNSPGFAADASARIAPNGKIYVAWRVVDSGVYYAERQSDGSWPITHLAGKDAYGAVSIVADRQSNLHVFWAGNISGGWDEWYAFKPVNGAWQGPVKAPGSASAVVNASGVASIGARVYGHLVSEAFNGSSSYVRYVLFGSDATGVSATPVLDGGNNATNGTSVALTFTNVSGTPTQMRWHWGAPPTDADAWQTYGPTSVPLPSGIDTTASCVQQTLFTQVRSSSDTQATAASDSIIVDRNVQANVEALNPFMAGLPQTYSRGVTDVYTKSTDGAYDGDPGYTRIPQYFLRVVDAGDCSGLKTVSVPASNVTANITGGRYENKITLPQGALQNPGPVTIGISLLDGLNNPGSFSRDLVYDPANTDTTGSNPNTDGLPVLGSGGKVEADTGNSIIRTLSFSGIKVTDNLYRPNNANSQFWGVWIANSRTQVNDPNSSTSTLKWYPARVSSPGSSFTVQWDLFTGLGYGLDRGQAGDYYVYVKFLDGAGNATTGTLSTGKVTLTQGYTIPTRNLPIILR